ncbi:MAG TPA: polysaccharide deacetylase family protein, partial [Nonomuraea sp.]|nr:polysaccharide deacetylase family protein [Nonomuraea sp.]
MHKARFVSGIALLAVSAGGCGLAAAAPERNLLVPAEPTRIDFADPASVAGLSVRALSEGDSSSGVRFVHISYPELADAPALNRALTAQAERQLRDFRERTEGGGVYPRPELNVDWQLAAASSEAVAVRLRTGEFLGASWGNSTRTLWYDPRTGKASGATGLLAGDGAVERLAALVKGQFQDRGPQVERGQVTGEKFDSMAFNRSGDLVVEFDDCEIGPCSLGRLAAAAPAREVTPLLSELGRRAQEAAMASTASSRYGPESDPDPLGLSPGDDPAPDTASDTPGDTAGDAPGPGATGDPDTTAAPPRPDATTGPDAAGEGRRYDSTNEPDAPEVARTKKPNAPEITKNTENPTPAIPSETPAAPTVDCARTKCVALTFDDGPGPFTAGLLDVLRRDRARATFFTVGSSAAAQPELVRRMSSEGHLVGNHSWAHKDLTKQATSKIADSLRRVQNAVAAVAGRAPRLVRPPYGAVSQEVRDVARRMGCPLVTWDVDAGDQEGGTAKDIARRAV